METVSYLRMLTAWLNDSGIHSLQTQSVDSASERDPNGVMECRLGFKGSRHGRKRAIYLLGLKYRSCTIQFSTPDRDIWNQKGLVDSNEKRGSGMAIENTLQHE